MPVSCRAHDNVCHASKDMEGQGHEAKCGLLQRAHEDAGTLIKEVRENLENSGPRDMRFHDFTPRPQFTVQSQEVSYQWR